MRIIKVKYTVNLSIKKMVKYLYIQLFSILLLLNISCHESNPISSKSRNITWKKTDSPILINNQFIVEKNQVLNIETGVEVKFRVADSDGNIGSLLIKGSLIANGSEGDSIIFTRQGDTGHWWNIRFENSPQKENILSYCTINHTISSAIELSESQCIIKNCEINGGGIGIECYKCSNLLIDHNKIFNNEGYGIRIINCYNPIIQNNIIYNNENGIYSKENLNLLVLNNIIRDNNEDGISCEDEDTTMISNNIIENNSSAIKCHENSNSKITSNEIHNNIVAIWLKSESYSEIYNNKLLDNDSGISCGKCNSLIIGNLINGNRENISESGSGIGCSSTEVKIYNNTIGNYSPSLYFSDNANIIIINTILYNAGCSIGVSNMSSGSIIISNSLIENNEFPNEVQDNGNNVINQDPIFIDRNNNMFQLAFNSPCINSGNKNIENLPEIDLAGNNRISGNTIDIGSYEFQE